jgi:hypothetical protein
MSTVRYVHINSRPAKNLTRAYCKYHATLHSSTRFGARRRHLQGVSYLTVRFFGTTADYKRLSKRAGKNAVCSLVQFFQFSRRSFVMKIVKTHGHKTLHIDVAFLKSLKPLL